MHDATLHRRRKRTFSPYLFTRDMKCTIRMGNLEEIPLGNYLHTCTTAYPGTIITSRTTEYEVQYSQPLQNPSITTRSNFPAQSNPFTPQLQKRSPNIPSQRGISTAPTTALIFTQNSKVKLANFATPKEFFFVFLMTKYFILGIPNPCPLHTGNSHTA